MDFSRLVRIGLLLLVFACYLPSSQAEDFVAIKIRGTKIDVFPDFVDIVTDNPRQAAAKLFEQGGRNLQEHKNAPGQFSVIHHEVAHIFHTPDDYNSGVTGHAFKEGDVIYKYWLHSIAEQKAFVKKYELGIANADTRLGDWPLVLYIASPGHYVFCAAVQRTETQQPLTNNNVD